MSIATIPVTQVAITSAVAGATVDIGEVPSGTKHIMAHSNFTYAGGAVVTAKFYLQSSADGVTWFDILSVAETTATSHKIVGLDLEAAGAMTVITDGTLTDNTKLDGMAGDRLRLKYTTTGTYTAGTTFDLILTIR